MENWKEMSQELREIIKQEYIKAASDPVHFMRKYCFIQHPQRGRVIFNLYPFQEKVLQLFQENEYNIILKSRQLGISTLAAGYALWLMLFHKDKNVLCIATKQETAKNMVTKVKFMYDNLPSWLKEKDKPTEHNKLTLRLNNGSQIKAVGASSDAGRSEAVSLLLVDEAAFIENIGEIWASAQQTLATGGGAIVLSTPYGTGNWFHQTWVRAEEKENNFLPIKLPWFVHPERNEAWRKNQDELLGDPRLAAQECFSGDVIIYTITGPKFIKDIKIGDQVLSHDGTYNKVIRTISSISNNAVHIKGGINNISKYTTLNHPFLNEKNEWEEINSLIDTSNMIELFPNNVDVYNRPVQTIDLINHIKANNPKYFPLKYNENSIWLTKTNIINRTIKFDYNLGFLVGCFMSEGSLANNKVEFSFNGKTERNGFPIKIEEILSDKFNINTFCYYTSKRWEGSSKLYIKDQIFNSFIKLCIQGGNLCHEKSLSEFFYNHSNMETLKGVIDGILVGDGMLKKEYNINLQLTSEKLIYDVLYINNLMGIHNISIKTGKARNPKDNNKWRPNYCLTWLNTKTDSSVKIFSERTKDIVFNTKSRTNFKYDLKPYVSLKLNKCDENIEVFNLEVENTHTYVTEYGIAHNCDCEFATSGDVVFYNEFIDFYEKTYIKDPLEKRGLDKNLWIWEPADYSRTYIIVADVSRGDSADYSAFHIIDAENNIQVGEYKGKLSTTDYGHLLVGIATEYNNALLVVENANIGWAVIQTIIQRGYTNLYYSPKNGEMNASSYFDQYADLSKMTPGFTTSLKNRPMIVSKIQEYITDRSVIIQSKRLIEEMRVFVYKNGRPEAQTGYNDDLVMSFGIGMYVRDTALKFGNQGTELSRSMLNSISSVKTSYQGAYSQNLINNPYKIDNPYSGGEEDISWLL